MRHECHGNSRCCGSAQVRRAWRGRVPRARLGHVVHRGGWKGFADRVSQTLGSWSHPRHPCWPPPPLPPPSTPSSGLAGPASRRLTVPRCRALSTCRPGRYHRRRYRGQPRSTRTVWLGRPARGEPAPKQRGGRTFQSNRCPQLSHEPPQSRRRSCQAVVERRLTVGT